MTEVNKNVMAGQVGKVNPDLQKERDSASFNPYDLTVFLYGGDRKTKHRRKIVNRLFEDPVFQQEQRYYQSLTERYSNAIHKTTRLMDYVIDEGWSQDDLRIASGSMGYDMAVAVHAVMFIPAIQRLGTPEQQGKWLPLAITWQVIGTYAQTELGHGTNLRGLETTATYDPNSGNFVLNTPMPSGMKWWPGGMAKSANHAIVVAQLYVNGENCGMQGFIVQLRDIETHQQMPGIEVGDIGPRFSNTVTDNGYLIMRNVQVPRENLLSKYSKVTAEGEFIRQPGSEKANYGPMILVRTNIVEYVYENMAIGATIATRYSAVRRQSELKPGAQEPQVLDFLTQQHKVFTNLALTYAIFFCQRYMTSYYSTIYNEELERGITTSLPELHSQSSGLKAFCSDRAMEGIEICRRSCGGHGYLLASGLCTLLTDASGSVTYEGENTVLYLQTARYLMKVFASAVAGETLRGSSSYLNTPVHGPVGIHGEKDCLNMNLLKQAFHCRAYFMIKQAAGNLKRALDAGSPQHEAWNNNSVEMVRAAKAHLDSFLAVNFIDSLSTDLDVPSEVKAALVCLCYLHTLHRIVCSSGEFLESGALTSAQLAMVKDAETKMLPIIRPNAVALVDAFDLHDQTLNSALGRYDGNVYEKLYEMARNGPMNKTDVHESFHKFIKPLQQKAKL